MPSKKSIQISAHVEFSCGHEGEEKHPSLAHLIHERAAQRRRGSRERLSPLRGPHPALVGALE